MRTQETGRTEKLANGIGWFSIGLGVAEIAAPDRLSRFIGVERRHRPLLLALGLREIASGVGILRGRHRSGWMWSRVIGDAIDLALLGAAMRSGDGSRGRLLAAGATIAGVTLVDVMTARQLARAERLLPPAVHGVHVVKSLTIARSPQELYRFWRQLDNLPRFMAHLESVEVVDDRRSIWKVKGPAGATVEWEAEITSDVPNELIAWRSLPGADVANAGMVQFTRAPGTRGTEVLVELRYDPPAGAIGRGLAALFGREPAQQVAGDLRRFKQVIETGEVVHSDASIHRGMHAAQPPRQLPSGLEGGAR
jgi:uncharacterized membrane protein